MKRDSSGSNGTSGDAPSLYIKKWSTLILLGPTANGEHGEFDSGSEIGGTPYVYVP